jgi:mono/diheme cytochrome c family protein
VSHSKFRRARRTNTSFTAVLGLLLTSLATAVLAQGSDWKAPPTAANRPNPVAGNANATALGQKLYLANCMTCHGQSGRGDGPGAAALEKKPADLTKKVRTQTDGELFWKISEGKSPMVSWKSLSETQRWELVNYIKTLAGK